MHVGLGIRLQSQRPSSGGAPPPSGPPLDTLTAAAAYSTRKLRTAYAGSAIRVRRSNDNLEADIGFSGNALDTAALTAHVGANSGFITTWYDQSGNGRNVTNATTGQQPRIVNAGTIEVIGTKPAVRSRFSGLTLLFNTSPFMYAAGAVTISAVVDAEATQTQTAAIVGEEGAGTPFYYPLQRTSSGDLDQAQFLLRNDAGTNVVANGNVAQNAWDQTNRVVTFRDTGSNYEGFLNGTRDGNTAYTRTGVLTLTQFRVGLQFDGRTSEIIIFTSALSDADMNTVIASQGGEYGITTVPFSPPPTGEALEFLGLTRDGLFAEQNQAWEGYTATFEGRPGGRSFGEVGMPTVFRRYLTTSSGAANRINVAAASSITAFDTYALPAYIDATARVYRVTNGVMDVVRESTVTGGKIGRWNWLQPNAARIVDALSYTHALDNFNRPGVPYFFRVAAVSASGQAGTWSAPVSFTPANMTGTASGTTNPTKAINKTSEGGALAAPGSVAVSAGVIAREAVITWAAVPTAEGYVVELSYYDPTEIDTVPHLELSSHATPILAGDLIIFSKECRTQDDTLFCSRVYNASTGFNGPDGIMFDTNAILQRDGNSWAYVPYSGDKPTGASGNFFVRRTAAASATAGFRYYWHSGTDQTFYGILQAGRTYRLKVIMRVSAARTVTFTAGGPTLTGTTFSVGTTFAEYTHDMTPATTLTSNTPWDWRLDITAGGTPVNLDVAAFSIEEVGISANPLDASVPANTGYLRDHRYIKPGPNGRNMADIIATGFKIFHDACVLNGCKPWVQFEWGTPKQDILDFVAFLAAPNGSGHPMADLRLSLGIADPWTTTFADLKFENGNEAWNPLGAFWVTPNMTDSATAAAYNIGNTAGLLWQMTVRWMQESPYWSTLAPKIVQHAGGWAINSFGEDAYRFFPAAKEVSIAAYNGGWDNGTALVSESGLSFNGVLADPIIIQKPRAISRVNALKAVCTSLGRTYGTDIRYTIYEAGPGYQLNGLNGASVTAAQVIEQELVMKSRAAAAATVDSMLTYAQQDFKGFNYFRVGIGNYWNSHGEEANGDAEFMSHALTRIIHEQIAPAKVYGAPTSSFGTKVVTLQGGTTATINQIGAYQLRSLATPSKRMIVLINRNIDPSQLPVSDPLYSATPSGTVAFNVTTTWNGATSLRAWTAGIGPYREHNRYPVGQRRVAGGGLTADPLCVAFNYASTTLSVPANVQNFAINAATGATSGGLPAGNVLILLFEGVT